MGKTQNPKHDVQETVEHRLKTCPYGFIFGKVTYHFDDGRLTLRGSVPSFYLKQVLQELLRDIEHVKKINNEVNVVSSHGLSSVRPQQPR